MFVELEFGSQKISGIPLPQEPEPIPLEDTKAIRVVCGATIFELPPGFDGNEFKRALLALKEAS